MVVDLDIEVDLNDTTMEKEVRDAKCGKK